jgi:hypothetical protein
MWQPRRLTTLWVFMACYGMALPLPISNISGSRKSCRSLVKGSIIIQLIYEQFDTEGQHCVHPNGVISNYSLIIIIISK